MAKNDDKKPAKFLMVDNSALFHELRSSMVSSDAWTRQSISAQAILTTTNCSVKATARIGPEPNAKLSDEAVNQWRARVASYVLTKLDDLNADILDAIFSCWAERCSSPDAMTVMHANDFFRYRGLRPRGHSYWTEQKREIASRIALLSNTWVNVFDAKGYAFTRMERSKLERIDTRVLVVSSVGEGTADDGSPEYAWRLRPGDIFMPMLLSRSGKQLAMMSRKVLEYNYHLYPYEKRAARYFTWLHRIRQSRGDYLKGIRVSSLLTAIRKPFDTNNPIRTKIRLERALSRLCDDGVICSWQYQDADEGIVGSKGWANEWKNWCLLVEPVQEVVEQYSSIISSPSLRPLPLLDPQAELQAPLVELVNCMRRYRSKRGITQIAAAGEIGIAPNYYSMIERGSRMPSPALKLTIEEWVKL